MNRWNESQPWPAVGQSENEQSASGRSREAREEETEVGKKKLFDGQL